jgi:hypothetical protein
VDEVELDRPAFFRAVEIYDVYGAGYGVRIVLPLAIEIALF